MPPLTGLTMIRLLAAAFIAACPLLPALADEKDDPGKPQFTTAERTAKTRERMKYFQHFIGEWVGEETYTFLAGDEKKETYADTWTGLYTLGGTFFEMHGTSQGKEGPRSYKWIATFDLDADSYRAWVFDENGSCHEYTMAWREDRAELVWTSDDLDRDTQVEFIMKPSANTLSGRGEIRRLSDGQSFVQTTMAYTRKRIRL